jgi:hypothetical protein
MPDYRQINVPADVCARAEQKFGKRFASIEQLVIFVLEELTKDQAAEWDKSEQALVEARLRDLGYL